MPRWRSPLVACAVALAFIAGLFLVARADVPLVQVTQSFTGTAVSQVIAISGQSSCSVVANSTTGSPTYTIVPQVSSDYPINNPGTWVTATGVGTGSITSDGTYVGSIASTGLTGFRVRVTSFSGGGTVQVVFSCSGAVNGSSGGAVVISPLPLPVSVQTSPVPTESAGETPPASALPVISINTCIFPAGGTPSPAPGQIITVPCDASGNLQVNVANTPGVTIQNTPGVICISGCGGAANSPIPTASAGLSPPPSLPPSLAIGACIYPLGNPPTLTAGNLTVMQCTASGQLQVTTAAPAATVAPTALPTATTGYAPPAAGGPPVNAYLICLHPSGTYATTAGNVGMVQCSTAGYVDTIIQTGASYIGATQLCANNTTNCVPPAAIPTASAGVAAPSTALPVAAYDTCQYNSGVIAVTTGHSIAMQCTATGLLQVNMPAPTVTLPVTTAAPYVAPTPAGSVATYMPTSTVAICAAACVLYTLYVTVDPSASFTAVVSVYNTPAASATLGTAAAVDMVSCAPGQTCPIYIPPTTGVTYSAAVSAGCAQTTGRGSTYCTAGLVFIHAVY